MSFVLRNNFHTRIEFRVKVQGYEFSLLMNYVDLYHFVLPAWNTATTVADCTYLGPSAGERANYVLASSFI